MLYRNIKSILVFSLVCVIGGLLSYSTNNSCSAIAQYRWTVGAGLGSLFFALLKVTLIFISGIILFLLVKKRIPHDKYARVKLIYFAILPLFVFYGQFLSIPKHFINRPVKESICNKSSTDGMKTKSNGINLFEYEYLKNKLFLLPKLPASSDSINVSYYTDDLMGDCILDIEFKCDINEQIDTTNKCWTLKDINQFANKKVVNYHSQTN